MLISVPQTHKISMVGCVASIVHRPLTFIRVHDMINQLHCPLRIFIKIFGTCPLAHGQVIQASIRGELNLTIYYSCNWLWDPTVRASSVAFESHLAVEKCGVRARFSWGSNRLSCHYADAQAHNWSMECHQWF